MRPYRSFESSVDPAIPGNPLIYTTSSRAQLSESEEGHNVYLVAFLEVVLHTHAEADLLIIVTFNICHVVMGNGEDIILLELPVLKLPPVGD